MALETGLRKGVLFPLLFPPRVPPDALLTRLPGADPDLIPV